MTRALQGISQGRDVVVDRASGRVEIAGAALDDAVVRAAIEDAGFVVAGRG